MNFDYRVLAVVSSAYAIRPSLTDAILLCHCHDTHGEPFHERIFGHHFWIELPEWFYDEHVGGTCKNRVQKIDPLSSLGTKQAQDGQGV